MDSNGNYNAFEEQRVAAPIHETASLSAAEPADESAAPVFAEESAPTLADTMPESLLDISEALAIDEPPQPAPKPRLIREALQPASIALGISAMMIFTVIAQLTLLNVIRLLAPGLLQENWFATVFSGATMYLIAFPLSIPFFFVGKAMPPEKKRLRPLAWFGALAVCFVLMLIGNTIGITLNEIIGGITGSTPQNDLNEMIANTPTWATFLTVAIGAPIVEEIMYRKLVIDRLRRYGDLFAVLTSAVIFGLIHGNFYQFFYAAFIGVLLGYVYVHTGRLRYTIALHMAFNFIGGVYSSEMLRFLQKLDLDRLLSDAFNEIPFEEFYEMILQAWPGILMMLLYYAFILGCIVATPFTIIFSRKHIRFQKATVKLRPWALIRTWLCNPAVWVMLAVVAYLFVG